MKNDDKSHAFWPTRYNLELRRRDREAEGAPLLREYAVMSCIKGSNPFVSANETARESGLFYWRGKKGENPWSGSVERTKRVERRRKAAAPERSVGVRT
jgi:hypothetical protein